MSANLLSCFSSEQNYSRRWLHWRRMSTVQDGCFQQYNSVFGYNR